MIVRRGLILASIFALSAGFAACSGGNTSAPVGPLGQQPPTTTPTVAPTTAPTSAPTAIAAAAVQPSFAPVASQPQALGAAGTSAALALPSTGNASVGGSITVALPAGQSIPAGAAAASLAAPASSGSLSGGVPLISSVARTPRAINGVNVTPSYYLGLQFTGFTGSFTISLSQLALTVPAVPSGAGVALALYDPGRGSLGWQQNFAFGSPAVVLNGTTATFTPPSPTFTVYANVVYWLAVYVYPLNIGAAPTTAPSVAPSQPANTPSPVPTATPAASPSPSPTPTPTPTPTPAPTLPPGFSSITLGTGPTSIPVPTASGGPASTSATVSFASSTGGTIFISPISATPPANAPVFAPRGGLVGGYVFLGNPGSSAITLNNASLQYTLPFSVTRNATLFPNGNTLYLAVGTSVTQQYIGNIAPAAVNASVNSATFQASSVTIPAGGTAVFAAYVMPSADVAYAQPSPGPQTVALSFSDPTNTYFGSFRTSVNTQGATAFSAINVGISLDPSGVDMPVFAGPYPSGSTGKNVIYGNLLWLADPQSTSVLSMNGNGGTVNLQLQIPNASALAKTFYLIGFDGPASSATAPWATTAPLASASVNGNTVIFTTTAGRTFVPNGNYGFIIVY